MRLLGSNGCMISRLRSRAKTTHGIGAFKPELPLRVHRGPAPAGTGEADRSESAAIAAVE